MDVFLETADGWMDRRKVSFIGERIVKYLLCVVNDHVIMII